MFHEIERDQRVTGKFFHRFVRMAGGCKGVIAGNHYLAEFARAARVPPGVADDNVVVLPTPVDTSIIPARAKATRSDPLVIGWIGTRGNLSHLKQIAGPLATVCGRHNGKPAAVFRVVSDARPDLPGVPLEYKPWSAQSEIADLQGFDIGVMPLSDDLWTRGKGGFKLLQYMAAGAAAIASPIGINQDVVRHGVNGLLAADETDWGSGLQLLVGDPVFRERLAGAARETVERDYSLEAYNRRLAVFLERML
jgi:glycosyltransferase involved in cell wall biosynthesis